MKTILLLLTFSCIGGVLFTNSNFKTKKTTPYLFSDTPTFPPIPDKQNAEVTIEGAELGRFLFYDTILSSDSSFSCASCHKQSAAFSDSPLELSSGVDGVPTVRNTPPIFNVAWYNSMFWDGRSPNVEDQALNPVRTIQEMNLPWTEAEKRIQDSPFYREKFKQAFGTDKIDSNLIVNAIGQFERTLISNRSKFDRVLAGKDQLTKDEQAGLDLMNSPEVGCVVCHPLSGANSLGTSPGFSDIGLDNVKEPKNYIDKGLGEFTSAPKDHGKFKVPSLRNVALTAPYMHDGRFATLEEVISFFSDGVNNSVNVDPKLTIAHKGGAHLTPEEQKQIITFLHTLTDTAFVTDPRFSDPYK